MIRNLGTTFINDLAGAKEEVAREGYRELASHFDLNFPPKPEDEWFVFEKLHIRGFWDIDPPAPIATVRLGFIAAWVNMEDTPIGDLAISGRFPESMNMARVAKQKNPRTRARVLYPNQAPPPPDLMELETLTFERKILVLGNRRYNCYWERVR